MRWLLAAILCFALVACGDSGDEDATAPSGAAQATGTANTENDDEPSATEVADAAPTAADDPEPTAGGVSISFLMVSGAAPGGRASVTIRTDPVGVECDISYTTPNGTLSEAEGLEPAVTLGSSTVSWEWTISTATEPGTGSVAVTCDGVRATSDIEIAVE